MIIIFYDNFENESKKNATELRTPKVTNVHRVVVDFPSIWIYYEEKLEEYAFPDSIFIDKRDLHAIRARIEWGAFLLKEI